jgi:hypothetical protein
MQLNRDGAKMELNVGSVVWIPCEVKPGPFPDERRVRIQSSLGEWIGFVSATMLQDPITEGETKVRIVIVDVQDDRFSAKIPGESIGRTLFGDLISRTQLDLVPT